jgi:hypothetical protein
VSKSKLESPFFKGFQKYRERKKNKNNLEQQTRRKGTSLKTKESTQFFYIYCPETAKIVKNS